MPSITLDGHTLSVDGRRLWVVSGTVLYTQTPRAQWGDRLRAAKEAGLNTIEVPVVWAAHEPRRGKFSFEGDLDLGAFIKLIDQHGMHAIVRVGPYIGEGLDMGGLPAWLPPLCDGKVRSHAPAYLAPVSAFLSQVCDRIASLQITGGPTRRGKGPIIALVAEHRWLCGDDGVISLATNTGGVLKEGTDYLAELARFLREGGINVPVIANNDLYHAAEAQIESWCGISHLHANLRQLRSQRPGQPRLVMGMRGAHEIEGIDCWGRPESPGPSTARVIRALAETLAAGAQFNLSCFAPGTRLGFSGGRLDNGPSAFVTPGSSGAVIGEAGQRTAMFDAVKRVATFASSFERVLCGLDPVYQPVTVSADFPAAARAGTPKGAKKAGSESAGHASVVHAMGSQGSVVFVFAPGEGRRTVKLVLGDGSTLPVTLDGQEAGWVLLDTHLGGRATLDYCNVCAFALVGKALVCYGPAGSAALLSINGSAVDIAIPDGDRPLIQEVEGVSLAMCNERSIDSAIATADGVWFGVRGLDPDGNPIPAEGVNTVLRLGADGSVRTASLKAPAAPKLKIALGNLAVASCAAYTGGDSPRYARIDAPATLTELGTPYGYGWMRAKVRSNSAYKAKVGLFESGDRVHVWCGGDDVGLVGFGPGAEPNSVPLSVPVAKGETVLTVLCDNLGRYGEGSMMGEPKGLFGQLWEVAAIKAGPAKIQTDLPLEPLKYRTPIMGLQIGDTTDPRRLTWKFPHKKKTPVFVCIDLPVDEGSLAPGLVLMNGEPVSVLTPGASLRLRIAPEKMKATNILQLAIVGDMQNASAALKNAVSIFAGDSCLTEKAEWSFAKWEPPTVAAAWEPVKKGGAARRSGEPTWWRAEFAVPESAGGLAVDTEGLSKGQVFVNGHNLGRYFTATAKNKAVGPQTRLTIPAAWLKAGQSNEVVIFDEHGFVPSSCRVVSV